MHVEHFYFHILQQSYQMARKYHNEMHLLSDLTLFLAVHTRKYKWSITCIFVLIGLILGGGLIIFVCALSDEFGSRPMTSSRNAIKLSAFMSNDSNYGNSTSNYNYGWSFMLAVLGFLCSEISAVLCITAFLNRFESEVRILLFHA